MDHGKLDQSEALVLDQILARISTHAPPPGVNLDATFGAWSEPAGREYIDAIYRPKPIESLLTEDLIIRRQWFLVTLPHVASKEDVIQIIVRAGQCGLLDGFDIHDRGDFFGLSRRQPTRLARFAQEWLAPQLDEAPIACTAELLLARAAIQEARRGVGLWPPTFIQPEQRPAIEVELVMLAQSTKAFGWIKDKKAPVVFRSAALAKVAPGAGSKSTDKALADKLAAAEKKINQLNEQLRLAQTESGSGDDSKFAGRFKRLYREHVQNYHPDKLSGRSELDRKVGEEVTRILNHLYQAIKA